MAATKTSPVIAMRNRFFLLLLLLSIMLSYIPFSSSKYDSMRPGMSLSVEKADDVLISENGEFTAGFYPVGINAYCFAIWFSKPSCSLMDCTVVWMANRDEPVNGKYSKLTLAKLGDVVLTDARRVNSLVWSTNTVSMTEKSVQLKLKDNGNLVLNTQGGEVLWQSFDSPTDTLLPQQVLRRDAPLISSKSRGNYSSGYYNLYFDNDNVLRLYYNGPVVSSVYWPDPTKLPWDVGRTTYNDSRVAVLDIHGEFRSSDGLSILSSDFGPVIQRILKVDIDGNVRIYSRSGEQKEWRVTWQLISRPCAVHGLCGPNAICMYSPFSGRSCSCLPGYERENITDWTYGCKSKFKSFCDDENVSVDFIHLPQTDFYGYDKGFYTKTTLAECKKRCLDECSCLGFQYRYENASGQSNCYPKFRLLNGHRSSDIVNIYVKLPKDHNFNYYQTEAKNLKNTNSRCSRRNFIIERTYTKRHVDRVIEVLVIFASALAGLEIIAGVVVFCSLIWTRLDKNKAKQGYHLAATSFRRYTYSALKAATKNFSKEIGRGATGSVYKAELPEGKIGAVKRLNVASGGEEEFLAEVSSIGKLNHMNLIEMWGYCAEGKHRLLVYEYMEHGSLAENISSPELDWDKRFDIALGSAKGLAYLHEECLEWVLHCDVKPQNIFLDSEYQPKVADFGLSKLLNRGVAAKSSEFSRIRGTRGYMAPEWVYNLPITSKVDVYSYGIVLLEIVTGKSPSSAGGEAVDWKKMTSWVREKNSQKTEMESWLREIVDPTIKGNFDMKKIKILFAVALQCVEEDRNLRPTMSQVVEMLLRHEDGELQN